MKYIVPGAQTERQGGGLERLPRPLVRQSLGGELAELVVDQRQE
jgi:hypothetical protein